MANARDVVFGMLRRWTAERNPPLLPERGDEAFAELSGRDRPFAFDLLTGVIRWRRALDAVIGSRLKQTVESVDIGVRAILWMGTYQLLFQAGTADYAAVDSAVDLAKKHRDTARASGLVNGVLRSVTRLSPTVEPYNGTLGRNVLALDFAKQVRFNADLFLNPGANPIGHLAQVRSHPPQYVEHLRTLYGDAKSAALLLRNNLRPVVTLRCDAAAVDVPAGAGLAPHAEVPRFLVAAEGWNGTIEELVRKGTLSPQDVTAAKSVRFLEQMAAEGKLKGPGRILDLCAGLGTKTIQLARAFSAARVVGADIDSVKLARLEQRAAQIKQGNVSVGAVAAGERFDVVLADVPCSNTGVMGKRVQSRWRWPELDHGALRTLQMKLLGQAAEAVAPGGAVVYSTCSIDPAENEKLVTGFVAGQAALRLVHEEKALPSLTNDAAATHDGGYFAVLSRRDV